MSIELSNSVTPQQQLPPLVKQSATYKLIVPGKVEEKIRYLCRKYPSDEWSGVLFYTHTGSFEGMDLVITCEDFFPMDLGNATFTQFKMDGSVAGYIAENIELFNCDMGLLHSHNKMSCFFSGTDTSTLRSEGNDTNCFVSLIVNNAGTYCAAITRKVKEKREVTTYYYGKSYEFFGDGEVKIEPPYQAPDVKQKYIDVEAIEYFMLDVEREKVNNPLDYLDARFDEIEAKKKEATDVPKFRYSYVDMSGPSGSSTADDQEFYDWLHSNRNSKGKDSSYEQPTLFSEEVMDELVDPSKWEPNPEYIHHLVCQLVTCSLIVNKDIDLKQWIVKHMQKKYDEIFTQADGVEFSNWAESYIEFIVSHYNDENVPEEVYDDFDFYNSKVAGALMEALQEYPANDYIKGYIDVLVRYAV